ncbi:MAG: Nramp family divalent metal transporter [Pseudomonadota bacterium]
MSDSRTQAKKLRPGPGALVAAAFIGPGTVTTCMVAGATHGFALIWVLVFATIATMLLQDMSTRLGVIARLGLGEALMQLAPGRWGRWAIAALVLIALAIGNAAYEAGNLAGGALGVTAVVDTLPYSVALLVMGAIAAGILWIDHYATIERILVAMVLVMSLAFGVSLFITRPDWATLLSGLRPSLPDGSVLFALGLIGTTIVPYNLFLHAATARQHWQSAGDLSYARTESRWSIGIGGLVSVFILATAATTLLGTQVASAADMALAVEPAFGTAAKWIVAIGLAAAGLTSAITAPLASAFVVGELVPCCAPYRRIIALTVLGIGLGLAISGIKPVALILLAQAANGILLPLVAGLLLVVMNRRDWLGTAANSTIANIAGASVTLLCLALGVRALLRTFGLWP